LIAKRNSFTAAQEARSHKIQNEYAAKQEENKLNHVVSTEVKSSKLSNCKKYKEIKTKYIALQ